MLAFTLPVQPQRLLTYYRQIPVQLQSLKLKVLQFVETSNVILNRYPPLKVFVYSLGFSSALPVFAFYSYSTATLFGLLTVASTFQLGFVLIGTFFVFWFILAALFFAALVTFWFTVFFNLFKLKSKFDKPEISAE